MTKWLSPEWFDQIRTLAEPQPPDSGCSARIQYQVTGGPDGDVGFFRVLQDGRPIASGGGVVEAPDVTLTAAWNDAAAMQRGDLDPSVAFMQGRLKVTGSMDTLLALLALTGTPGYQDLRQRIADVTDF